MIGFCCFQTQTFQMVNTNIVKILILLVQGNYLLSPFQLFSSGWKELNADMGQDRNSLLPRTEIIWIPLIQIFTSIHNINWDTCNKYEYAFPGRSPHLLHLPSVQHFQSFNRSQNLRWRKKCAYKYPRYCGQLANQSKIRQHIKY